MRKISTFVALFLTLTALFYLTMGLDIGVYDEGLILTGALRVYYGEYPHLDFYANYGPAQFYIIGYLYKIFGPMLMVERLFDLATRALIVIVSYLTLSKVISEKSSKIAALIILLYLLAEHYYGYPVYQAFLFIMLGLMLLVRYVLGQKNILMFLYSGLLIGIAALFRYDVGFFAYLALGLSITVFSYLYSQRTDKITLCKQLMLFSIGAAIPVGLILLSHYSHGAMDSFIHDVITFPAQYYNATRSLPFPKPGLQSIPIYLPVITVCIALTLVLSIKFKEKFQKIPAAQTFVIVSLLFLVVFLYLKGLVRVSLLHMLLGIMPSILLSVCIYDVTSNFSKLWRIIGGTLTVLFLIPALIAFRPMLGAIKKDGVNKLSKTFSYFDHRKTDFKRDWIASETNSDRLFRLNRDRVGALNYLDKVTHAGDFFYSGLSQHDKVFINDISVYFLLNLKPATKWHQFDPALQNSQATQLEIISDLTNNQPTYIWLDSSWNSHHEGNDSDKSSSVFDLDTFLAKHYQLDKCFGKVCIHRLTTS